MKIPVFLTVIIIALSACSTTHEIIKQGENTIEYKDRVQIDSMLSVFKDSVFVNGDTVKIYRDRWRTVVKIKSDTIYKSVDKFVNVDKLVIKELSFFEKFKMVIGWVIVAFVAGLIVAFFIK